MLCHSDAFYVQEVLQMQHQSIIVTTKVFFSNSQIVGTRNVMLLLARGRLRRMSTVFIIIYSLQRGSSVKNTCHVNCKFMVSCSYSNARNAISV